MNVLRVSSRSRRPGRGPQQARIHWRKRRSPYRGAVAMPVFPASRRILGTLPATSRFWTFSRGVVWVRNPTIRPDIPFGIRFFYIFHSRRCNGSPRQLSFFLVFLAFMEASSASISSSASICANCFSLVCVPPENPAISASASILSIFSSSSENFR